MKKIITFAVCCNILILGCSPVKTATTSTVTASSKIVEQGASIYTNKCGGCHKLYKSDEFTAEKWTAIVERMAPKAHLTAEEKKNVLAYVYDGAKK